MQFARANSIFVALGCAIALVSGGCVAPWSMPASNKDVSKSVAASAATPPNPMPAVAPVGPDTATPDMTVVLDKLQQVQAMDPAAEQRLLDELRTVPPSTWPLVAEQFRASLAYHQQLAEKSRTDPHDSQPVVDLRRAPPVNSFATGQATQFMATNLAYDRSATSNDDRPSGPIGSLADPHSANSESVPVLARSTPYSMPRPAANAADLRSEPRVPAQFTSDGPAYPIANRGDAIASDPAAGEPHIASQALVQANGAPANRQALAEEMGGHGQAIRLPDTRSAADVNWQQSIQKAITDLEHRVSPSPTTTAEVHQHVSLRILRLLSGDTEKALEPIPHISPTEQDYWSQQLFALATYLDHHSQPDDKRRAAASVTHLDEALSNLRELGCAFVAQLVVLQKRLRVRRDRNLRNRYFLAWATCFPVCRSRQLPQHIERKRFQHITRFIVRSAR